MAEQNQNNIREVESKIFTPSLQQALNTAKEKGYSFNDSMLGAANAYLNMVVKVLGKEEAIKLLQGQLEFLNSQG